MTAGASSFHHKETWANNLASIFHASRSSSIFHFKRIKTSKVVLALTSANAPPPEMDDVLRHMAPVFKDVKSQRSEQENNHKNIFLLKYIIILPRV